MVDQDCGATLAHWLNVIRRAHLSRNVTTVAYYLAGRANNDGTHVYPGVWRTAVECRMSVAEVRRALKLLRDAQLLARVNRNRRRGKADEYRLTIGADTLEHVKVPSGEEHDAAINALRDREREQQQRRQARWSARRRGIESTNSTAITPPMGGAIPEDNAHQDERCSPEQRSGGVSNNAHPDERPPRIGTSPVEATPLTDAGDLRTEVAVGGGYGGRETLAPLAPPDEDDDDQDDQTAPAKTRGELPICRSCGVYLDPDDRCGNRNCTDWTTHQPDP